jgi:hypothetical protein
MNKKILAAVIAATCVLGAVHTEVGAKEKAKKAKKQSLGSLSCLENQIAEFNGVLWACTDTPSGGGAPEYEFVDGYGNILGDVVYIENGVTAWGYINDLSTTSTIQVTATYDKRGRQQDRLAGNVKSVRVWYDGADCSGAGYLADYESGTGYWVQGGYEPVPFPPFLTFLETEPTYYLPDTPFYVGPASTWTEVLLGSTTGVYDFESFNFTNDLTQCENASMSGYSATQIDSLGITIDAPMSISVVEK